MRKGVMPMCGLCGCGAKKKTAVKKTAKKPVKKTTKKK